MYRWLALFFVLFLASCSSNPLPENCEIRHDDVCYQDAKAACAAAGCPENCTILRSYPGQVECAQEAAKPAESTPSKTVLFILSGHTELGDTGKKTGYFLGEVAHPWHVLTTGGVAVEFASPKGGPVVADPKSVKLDDPINKAFVDNEEIQKALESTLAATDIDPTRYAGIYFAGGHGAMWDFPDNESLSTSAAKIYESGGLVAAVCHGPAGLVNIKLSDGSYLVAGKKVAAFTNSEEEAVKLTETVPFLLATKLEERGAVHVPAADFQEQVVVDQRLITGQNPASATGAGEAMLNALRDR